MDKDGVDQNNGRSGVYQQAIANHRNREILGKPGPPDNHPGHQQHENHAHDGPEHHLLPGVIFTDPRHLMLVAFQHLHNAFQPRNILFIRDVVMDKTHEHKHQGDKNQHAKEGVQNTPHLRGTEGFRQPLQRREEKRYSRQRHEEETDNHRPVTGAIDKGRAHYHLRFTHHAPPRRRQLPCSARYRCSDR